MTTRLGRAGIAACAAVLAVAWMCAQQTSPPRRPRAAHGEPTVVFVTGSDDGYLDACGCDDGLLGGLPRRHTALRNAGGAGDQGLLLSNGRLVAGRTALDAMKIRAQLVAMQAMGYDAIALSERELALGRAELVDLAGFLGADCPLLATNLRDEGTPPLPTQPSLEREVAKRNVLVLAAVAPSRAELFHAADPKVTVVDPVPALEKELDAHPDVEHVVVLAQASLAEAGELAQKLPRVDLFVVQGPDEDEDPKTKPVHAGNAAIVTTGRKGRFVVSWRFEEDAAAAEFRREPVEDTLLKSEEVESVVATYYRDLLKENSPRPIDAYLEKNPTKSGASYAGAAEGSCASCHPKAWATWAASRHARAWRALVEQDLPPKPDDRKSKLKNAIFDPDCVKCHVTGFGEVSGWAGLEKEKLRETEGAPLANVTCEACHGPSGDHAQRAQNGDVKYPGGHAPKMPPDAKSLEAGAKPLTIEEGELAETFCKRCHDQDNSPSFLARDYWNGIKNGRPVEPVAHGKE